MNEQFRSFLQSPNRETYLALRNKIISSESYQPYSDEFEIASELYGEQKLQQARDTLQKSMANLLLSARAHQLLGFLHSKTSDVQAAQAELMIANACVEGILATGNGSVDSPYIVVRTSDEHDVIDHLGKELESQSLSHINNKHLDLIRCKDGTEYWFDITDAFEQLKKKFKK